MAVNKQEVILEFNADTGKAEKSVNNLADGYSDLEQEIQGVIVATKEEGQEEAQLESQREQNHKKEKKRESERGKDGKKRRKEEKEGAKEQAESTSNYQNLLDGVTGKLDEVSGGSITAFKSAVGGLKAVKAGIASTGIGLLVQAVIFLIQKFAESETGAKAFKKASTALGVVTKKISDAFKAFGDIIKNAIDKPGEAIDYLKGRFIALGEYLVIFFKTYLSPYRFAFLKLKEGALAAAAGIKEFFGGDASELRKQLEETRQDITDLGEELKDNVQKLAEPFVEAGKALAEFGKDLVNEISAANAALSKYENQQKGLEKSTLSFVTASAKAEGQLKALDRVINDTTKSYDERVKATEEAAAIEANLLAERRKQASLQLSIAQYEKKDAKEIAQLRANLIRLDQEALDLKLDTEDAVKSLRAEEAAAAQEAIDTAQAQADKEKAIADQAAAEALKRQQDLEDELYKLSLTAQEQEEQAAQQEYERRAEAANGNIELETKAKELLYESLAEIDQRYREEKEAADAEALKLQTDKEKEAAETRKQQVIDAAKSTLNVLSDLNSAFAGESEQEQKKAFERSKKIQKAQALISTYESAVQAYKSLAGIPVVGPALGAAAAVAAIKTGLNNIKAIDKQTYQSPSAEETQPVKPASASAGGDGAIGAPTLDLGFLGGGAGQAAPVQAYVLSENVSNAQQANQKIQDQATL